MKYYITIVVLLMSILAIGFVINQTDEPPAASAPANQPATKAPGSEDNALKNLKL